MSREQGYAACEALGWPGTGVGGFVMPYDLEHLDEASVITGKEDQVVAQLQFWLTDVVCDSSAQRVSFMTDFFQVVLKAFWVSEVKAR